jgi:cytochrome c551/c552
VLVAIAFGLPAKANPPEEGKTIFLSRCAACHNVNKVLTGPALSGVYERRNIDWIINFVHSSQSMVKKGDSAAVALFEKFNRIVMPDHSDLTEADIKNVVEYIKVESKPAGVTTTPFAKPTRQQTQYRPLSINNYLVFGGYIFVVILLAAVLYYAVYIKSLSGSLVEKKLE